MKVWAVPTTVPVLFRPIATLGKIASTRLPRSVIEPSVATNAWLWRVFGLAHLTTPTCWPESFTSLPFPNKYPDVQVSGTRKKLLRLVSRYAPKTEPPLSISFWPTMVPFADTSRAEKERVVNPDPMAVLPISPRSSIPCAGVHLNPRVTLEPDRLELPTIV